MPQLYGNLGFEFLKGDTTSTVPRPAPDGQYWLHKKIPAPIDSNVTDKNNRSVIVIDR